MPLTNLFLQIFNEVHNISINPVGGHCSQGLANTNPLPSRTVSQAVPLWYDVDGRGFQDPFCESLSSSCNGNSYRHVRVLTGPCLVNCHQVSCQLPWSLRSGIQIDVSLEWHQVWAYANAPTQAFPFLEVFMAHEEVFLIVGVGMEHLSGVLA